MIFEELTFVVQSGGDRLVRFNIPLTSIDDRHLEEITRVSSTGDIADDLHIPVSGESYTPLNKSVVHRQVHEVHAHSSREDVYHVCTSVHKINFG